MSFSILLFCYNLIISQTSWSSLDSLISNSRPSDSLLLYYKNTNKAELKIVKGNFKKAGNFYEKAFTYVENPFWRDINNALKCELYGDKNKDRIMYYVWKKTYISGKKDQIYSDTLLTKLEFWPEIKFLTDTMHSGVDTSISSMLVDLLAFDQKYRSEFSGKNESKRFEKSSIDSINKIDAITGQKLIDLLKEHKGYSEGTMGENWNSFVTILNHNRENHELYYLLLESVFAGKLSSNHFINILAWSSYRESNPDMVPITSCRAHLLNNRILLFFKLSKENRKFYDNQSKKLMIDSYKIYRKKIIWQFRQDPRTFYFNYETGEIIDDTGFWDVIISNELRGKEYKVFYKSSKSKRNLKREARKFEKSNE